MQALTKGQSSRHPRAGGEELQTGCPTLKARGQAGAAGKGAEPRGLTRQENDFNRTIKQFVKPSVVRKSPPLPLNQGVLGAARSASRLPAAERVIWNF